VHENRLVLPPREAGRLRVDHLEQPGDLVCHRLRKTNAEPSENNAGKIDFRNMDGHEVRNDTERTVDIVHRPEADLRISISTKIQGLISISR